MRSLARPLVGAIVVAGLAVAAGCGSGSSSSSGSAGSTPTNVPQVSAANLPVDFSAMKQLTAVAKAGKGKIGVLLPDTTSSARYVEFDAPYLTKAFEAAGLSPGDFK